MSSCPPVHLLGHSYGGICALEVALRTGNLATLVLDEPALGLDGSAGIPASFIEQLDALVAAGERDRATELMLAGTDADLKPRSTRRC